MDITLFGLQITSALVVLGLITGMTYGVLAVGLVVVHRSTGVINFAHGEIGAFGAAVCGVLVVRSGFPYWIAFITAILVSAGTGAVTEMAVVRRLRSAPRLMSLVATLGVAQFLLAFSAVVNSQARSGSTFPQPAGIPEFYVGDLFVTRAYSTMLFVTPCIVFGLAWFLRRSRFGVALRAAAANPERARMAGISAGRMSTMAWAVGGMLAAYTTVLIIPTRGFITAEALGPVLLLRALAPAVIARMGSLPIALGAGLAIGIADQVLIFNYPASGIPEVFLLLLIGGGLLFQAREGGRRDERQDWGLLQPWEPVPEALTRIWAIRNLGRIVAGLGLVGAVLVGLLTTNANAVTMVTLIAFSLIGLSLGIVTGLGGQLSLGQFALAGVGATASYVVTSRFGNFVAALIVAGLVTAIVSIVLGLPALRLKGLLLGVVTLSFALASQRWLLAQSWALGSGVSPGRPVMGSISLESTRLYYFWALAVLAIGIWLASNVWRGGVGLRLRAVRDNEDGARAFGISATSVKLQGFMLAGILTGMGGALYGHLLSRLTSFTFDVVTSINIVALTVLGGIGLLAGPILGAIYIIGVPLWLPLDNAGLAASALGWLLLILYFPGGIAQVLAGPRRWIIARLARQAGEEAPLLDAIGVDDEVRPAAPELRPAAPGRQGADSALLLAGVGLRKSYGGLCAVDGIDIELHSGEILGLIGPNGAGKTTLFELLGGFTAVDEGEVRLAGQEITRLTPEARARLGLIRSFQDAALFPTLTVTEAVALAFERREPTSVLRSSLGIQRAERHKIARSRQLVSLMGLQSYRATQVRALSTGTRRICELACIVALEPRVLLLDEPSSGIAQRESEALGEVLLSLRDHLDCAMVIIEHDIPLLMGLSTRVMAMDAGRLLAVGSPAEVRQDPLVVASYLGGDLAAIERSGSGGRSRNDSRFCSATTRAGQPCKKRAGADGVCAVHRSMAQAR